MESKYFTLTEDELLISLIKDYPILYDLKHRSIKNGVSKDCVWKQIAESLNKTVPECKTRWRTIRDSYRKNKIKQLSGAKTYSGGAPKSKYNNENLKFLDETFVEKDLKTSAIKFESIPQDTASNEHLPFNHKISEDSQTSQTSLTNQETFSEFHIKSETYEPSHDNVCFNKNNSFTPPVPNTSRLSASEDSTDLFFKSMGKIVKEFPPHLIGEARVAVCKLVTDIEEKARVYNASKRKYDEKKNEAKKRRNQESDEDT